MLSRDFVFWEVDVQADFMLPGVENSMFQERRNSCPTSAGLRMRPAAVKCF